MKQEFKITDLSYDFLSHPVTGNLVLSKNQEAIKQSIKTLLFLNLYEKPYNLQINAGIRKYLFENINILDADILKSKIEIVLLKFEPRILLENIDLQYSESLNSIVISINYKIVNQNNISDSISFVFGRTR